MASMIFEQSQDPQTPSSMNDEARSTDNPADLQARTPCYQYTCNAIVTADGIVNMSQAAARQAQRTCEADLKLAALLNKEGRAQHAQELQDFFIAKAMGIQPAELLPELAELPDLTTCAVTLLVATRVHMNTAGLAVQLMVESGKSHDAKIYLST